MKNSTLFKKAITKGFKLDFWDIETSPYLIMGYGLKKTYISHNQILKTMKVTSAVVMSENTKEIETFDREWKGPLVITEREVKGGTDDVNLVNSLVKRLSTSDMVIGQNGDRYDEPVLQYRAYELGLKPVKNLVSLDTLKMSRKSFMSPSHKLDHHSRILGLGGKIDQTMDDCMDVARGNHKKQALRIKYNVKDVTDLRKYFWRAIDYFKMPEKTLNMLRNYIKEERPFCLKCAAKRQKRFEYSSIYVKSKGSKHKELKYQCNNCDFIWRPKKS